MFREIPRIGTNGTCCKSRTETLSHQHDEDSSLLPLEELKEVPDGDTPFLAIPPDIYEHRYPEYTPDHQDLMILGQTYLEQAIALHKSHFFFGTCEDPGHSERRFNQVANILGNVPRKRIIDEVDNCNKQHCGDNWELFKFTCNNDFWSKPADPAALKRIAEKVAADYSYETAGDVGTEYIQVLMALREAMKTGVFPAYFDETQS